MPCKIAVLWEYLAPCTSGVQASRSCLGRKILSSALQTKDELLPQHRLFTCSYFLGISVGLQAPLLMGLCRTTPGFSHIKGQDLKIIRGQCVVRRQQQISVFWDTWTANKKRFYFTAWLSWNVWSKCCVRGWWQWAPDWRFASLKPVSASTDNVFWLLDLAEKNVLRVWVARFHFIK